MHPLQVPRNPHCLQPGHDCFARDRPPMATKTAVKENSLKTIGIKPATLQFTLFSPTGVHGVALFPSSAHVYDYGTAFGQGYFSFPRATAPFPLRGPTHAPTRARERAPWVAIKEEKFVNLPVSRGIVKNRLRESTGLLARRFLLAGLPFCRREHGRRKP